MLRNNILFPNQVRKAKYQSIPNDAAELTCLAYILKDLWIFLTFPPILYCDYLSALQKSWYEWTINLVFMHIVNILNWIIILCMKSCSRSSNHFTKPMSKTALKYFPIKLYLQPQQSLREGISDIQNGNYVDQRSCKDSLLSWSDKDEISHTSR